jgi:hypothetical protein
MKKITVFALVFSLLLGLAGCAKKGSVAIVNGVEISREAFDSEVNYDLASYESQGVTLTDEDIAQVKQNAVDRLINTHLLKEAAIKAGITAESVDVDGELTAVKDSFSDEATFNQALADAEFTLESYKSVLTDILMIEALFEQELELSKIEVGEEEIQAMVDLYLENYGGEDEIDEEDLRDYLAYTLKEEKAEARRSEYIEKLRKESKIEYLVDF